MLEKKNPWRVLLKNEKKVEESVKDDDSFSKKLNSSLTILSEKKKK